ECDSRRALKDALANRPRLSVAPESFAPSAARHSTAADAFQTVRRARSFCLRDSGGGCSFGATTALQGQLRTLPRGLPSTIRFPETRVPWPSSAAESTPRKA